MHEDLCVNETKLKTYKNKAFLYVRFLKTLMLELVISPCEHTIPLPEASDSLRAQVSRRDLFLKASTMDIGTIAFLTFSTLDLHQGPLCSQVFILGWEWYCCFPCSLGLQTQLCVTTNFQIFQSLPVCWRHCCVCNHVSWFFWKITSCSLPSTHTATTNTSTYYRCYNVLYIFA